MTEEEGSLCPMMKPRSLAKIFPQKLLGACVRTASDGEEPCGSVPGPHTPAEAGAQPGLHMTEEALDDDSPQQQHVVPLTVVAVQMFPALLPAELEEFTSQNRQPNAAAP